MPHRQVILAVLLLGKFLSRYTVEETSGAHSGGAKDGRLRTLKVLVVLSRFVSTARCGWGTQYSG